MEYSRAHPSPEYVAAVKASTKFHATSGKFDGQRTNRALHLIGPLFKERRVRTALDYGCGKAVLYKKRGSFASRVMPTMDKLLGINFTLYDPCVPAYSRLPNGKFDGVLVVDVLEFVPDQDVPWVMKEIMQFATQAVFLSVNTSPPKKLVNADYYRPETWWLERIVAASRFSPAHWQMRIQLKSNIFRVYERDVGFRLAAEEIQEKAKECI